MKFIFAHAVFLKGIQVELVYVCHHVKVRERKKVDNLNSCNATFIANNSGSYLCQIVPTRKAH